MRRFNKLINYIFSKPQMFFRLARSAFLFYFARIMRVIIFPQSRDSSVAIGKDVAIQKLSSISVQKPDASIRIGNNCIIYENARIDAYGKGKINIGNNVIIGDARLSSRYSITIGNNVLFSWNVFIQDFNPHPIDPDLRRKQVLLMTNNFMPLIQKRRSVESIEESEWNFPGEDIVVGDDVWLGANTTILKGAKIGKGSIVSTGSVVRPGNYPDNSIFSGNPAKVVKIIR